jgi:mannose-1-phosphate guanylyltransferase/mannose-6-phosphate isomerase
VPDIEEFISTIQSGVSAAKAGYIVTFGVQPSLPSTAYGYIKQGVKLNKEQDDTLIASKVDRFVEKPSLDRAQEMLLSGDYLWNAGIFLCKASVLIDALNIHAKDIFESCHKAMASAQTDGNFVRPDKEAFLSCR